ncbi:isobutyryl-CoA dehydrogenase [Parendozoicomonas haliclonae]|uniref:Acyl-CoA dehydrogenase n=1 Tax=Parendozoicomonas haliclonae TaxID=1960125 RepID=A0A1X7ANR4_9GAMM|nr:isobutyryl-CoA dehydrogenase [Parendozoicomonas haliclonae]SMA48645.1 Acyl-CoA dehydrogenase [Parendozoicomonas haliclonae]
MNFELTSEQKAFQKAARDFARQELAPHAAEWDRTSHFPVDIIKKAGELGFLSIYTPEHAGGMGLSRLDASLIFEELSAGCTTTAAFMTIHNMATWMVATFGNEQVRDTWCPELVTGEKLASYCLTEPGAGSDAASLKTTAVKEGDHYVINGSKCFISGAGSTDVLVAMVRTGEAGPKGISTLVIPADAEGISYGRKEEKMGWNSQPTRTITFEDVRVPVANRLGEEGEGFRFAMKGLDGGRINIATCSLGTARAAIEQARTYLHERKQFGKEIGEFQALQFKLADMATGLVASRQMVHLAAAKLDAGDAQLSSYCAMAKRFATDTCFDVCNDALQLHGGYGYIREYPLERFVRDSRVHQILEGTNEIMRVIIARRLLSDETFQV